MKTVMFISNSSLAMRRFLMPLVSYYESRDFKVLIVTPERMTECRYEQLTVPFERPPSIDDVLVLFKLRKLVREKNITDVISVTPKALFLSALLQNKIKKTHILTGQRWTTFGGLKRFFFKNLDRFLLMRVGNVLLDGPGQLTFLRGEAFDISNMQCITPGSICGVPRQLFLDSCDDKKEFYTQSKTLGFLGRVHKDKGIVDLCELASDLAVNFGCKILVAGPVDDTSLIPLMEQSGVSYVGFVEQPEKFLDEIDILLIPSVREGFGLVFVEAAARGIPSICYDIYGTTGAVVNGENGYRVELGNLEEVINAVDLVFQQGPRYWAERCVKHAAKFEQEKIILDIFHRIEVKI